MKKILSLLLAGFCISTFTISSANAMTFTDVNPEDWYYDAVKSSVESGLIKGKSTDSYDPAGNLTYAEAIKLAACMHQLYTEGEVTLENGEPWYQTYVDYCKAEKIISKEYSYNEKATRAGYMEIFANALPDEALKEINSIPDNSIPDVKMTKTYAKDVYKLYRAGILKGVDDKYTCNPDANINRGEVAVIVLRMMKEDKRETFTTVLSNNFEIEIIPSETIVVEVKVENEKPEGDDGKVTKNEITDYDVILNPDIDIEEIPTIEYVAPELLQFVKQPEKIEVPGYGYPAHLSVEVKGGKPPYSYQWKYRDGRETFDITDTDYVKGANTPTLEIFTSPDEKLMGTNIRCVITDAEGSYINSDWAAVFGPFAMNVDSLYIGDNGQYTIAGRLSDGRLLKGEKISVERDSKIIAICVVEDIQMFGKSLDEAVKGDNVGLVVKVEEGVTPHVGDSAIEYRDFHVVDTSDVVN